MFSRMTVTMVFVVLCSITCFAQDNSKTISAVDFTIREINGKKVQLKKLLADGPVLLDFWALWCVPCLKEMPELKKIAKKYKESGLTIVAVNQDSPSDQSKVKPFVKQKRFNFVVVLDEDKDLWDQFNVNALPTSILIDQTGHVVYTHTGYRPGDEAEIIKALEELFSPENEELENGDKKG